MLTVSRTISTDGLGLDSSIWLASVCKYWSQVPTFLQSSWVNEVSSPLSLTQMSPASHTPTALCTLLPLSTFHFPLSKLAPSHSFILCPYCRQSSHCLVNYELPISPKGLWTSWVWVSSFSVTLTQKKVWASRSAWWMNHSFFHVLRKYWALSVVQEAGRREIRHISSLPWWRVQSWVGDRFSKLPNYTCEQCCKAQVPRALWTCHLDSWEAPWASLPCPGRDRRTRL